MAARPAAGQREQGRGGGEETVDALAAFDIGY
jgi:hypothetical protein